MIALVFSLHSAEHLVDNFNLEIYSLHFWEIYLHYYYYY